MKNPAVASAAVLIALALAVGGFAWMATGSGAADGSAAVLTRSGPADEVSFTQPSPREQRKKTNLEQAKRELHRIRNTGEEVAPGVFKINDATGDPTYYVGDLLPGKGRDGEPMYLSVQFKRMPAPPLKERKKMPSKFNKLSKKKHDGVLKTGSGDGEAPNGPAGAGGGPGAGGASGDGSGSGSGGGGASGGGGGSGANNPADGGGTGPK